MTLTDTVVSTQDLALLLKSRQRQDTAPSTRLYIPADLKRGLQKIS